MYFECERFFHVYTRANTQKELLFREPDNYLFFLKRYRKYISPVFDTLSFCLMPNHYHFLVRVKDMKAVFSYQSKKHYKYKNDELRINDFLQQQFANFHISYAKAYNNKYNRRGSLFQTKPKAKEISGMNSCLRVCRYIHRNPIKHGIVKNLESWQYSSYLEYLDKVEWRILSKEMILSQFDSLTKFINYIKLEIDDYEMSFEDE